MALSRQRAYSTTSTPPRTFTLPVRPPILDLKDPGSDFLNSGVGGAEHIQVLFAHSNSRIVNFTFSATTTLAGQPLPWKSPLERTIASGPLRIYKTVPHDVAFLQSGSALRPLLSRTQCWNVDGKATFCLQLRPGNYWRIEILGVEPEQDVKCAEFRDAMGKIVAFEVTACPFIRTEDCSPVTETPDALQPAKVWRRPTARRIDDATNDVSPEQSGGIFRDFRPTDVERPSTGEKPRLRLDPAISFKDIPSFDIARSWTNGAREESPTVMQRRSRYESLFTGGTFKPLRDENIPDRRRSSLAGEFVFARQQWRSEHSGDSKKLEELCVFDDEKHDGLGVAVGRPKSARALLFEACGLPEDDELEQTEACKTPPSEMYGSNVSPLAIKSTQMITNDDEYPSPESQLWRDFSPPHSPLSPKQKAFGVVAPFVAPPVLNDASVLGTPSRQSSCPATLERPPALTQWHTPAQQPAHPESRQRSQDRSQAIPTVSLTTPQISPAPALPSDSESESEADYVHLPRTPLRPRPSTTALIDPHTIRPRLRRTTSSLVLARAADVAAATANFVVLKPSAFLVAMMFSIAARIATRAVTGAAYSLAERGDLGLGWDMWDDDDDDGYFLAPPRSERRRRKSDVCERRAWGLDERERKTRK